MGGVEVMERLEDRVMATLGLLVEGPESSETVADDTSSEGRLVVVPGLLSLSSMVLFELRTM